MPSPISVKTLENLNTFTFGRILNDDPLTRSVVVLGSFPNGEENVQAILRIEKTALSPDSAPEFFGSQGALDRIKHEETTDIYSWLFGWFKDGPNKTPDVKVNVIYPATEVHIRKYTRQSQTLFRETPEIYQTLVKPYIDAFPPSRTQWVEDILSGKAEQSKLLVSNADYVLLPDMKWDMQTLTSLYLLAIVHDRSIRSIRDLRKRHLGLLNDIRRTAQEVVTAKWGIPEGGLRLYVHYQPSYYHFHVHIVSANYEPSLGMAVGQAHLLDDIISLLELDPDDGPGIFERRTLTYGLGEQHALYSILKGVAAN